MFFWTDVTEIHHLNFRNVKSFLSKKTTIESIVLTNLSYQ